MARAKATEPAKHADPFEALPEEIRTAIAVVPSPQNSREAAGTHLNPRMGRLLRAYRAVNGNISQVKVAKGEKTPGLTTTHCQIATLEQGGCKKGADTYTVKLLATALGVDETVVSAVNEADLRERYERGDKLAGKMLGVEEPEGESETAPAEGETEPAPEPAQL